MSERLGVGTNVTGGYARKVDRPVAVVFVRLLNEGIDVWRPVPAEHLGNGRYRLTDDFDYARASEDWEFPPGSTVMGERLRDGPIRVVSLFVPN